MTNEREPLWSDTQIDDEVYTDFRHIDSDNRESIVGLARRVRDDMQARIAELEQEQIALWHTINTQATYAEELEQELAQTWQPLPDGTEWFGDDEFYLTASLSGTLLSMGRNDDLTGPTYYIQLNPNEVRLCRLVTEGAALDAQPTPLDMPDGPGWWAFEGQWHTNKSGHVFRDVTEVRDWDGNLEAGMGNDWEPVEFWVGKWYRLTMPWEVRHE